MHRFLIQNYTERLKIFQKSSLYQRLIYLLVFVLKKNDITQIVRVEIEMLDDFFPFQSFKSVCWNGKMYYFSSKNNAINWSQCIGVLHWPSTAVFQDATTYRGHCLWQTEPETILSILLSRTFQVQSTNLHAASYKKISQIKLQQEIFDEI